jgi:TPR repeat protein
MRLAVYWFRCAANHWSSQAQFQLAMCSAKGVGTPKNIIEAYMWANLASRNGYENAKLLCELLENRKLINDAAIVEAKQRADAFTRTNPVTAAALQLHDVVENIHLYGNPPQTNSAPCARGQS